MISTKVLYILEFILCFTILFCEAEAEDPVPNIEAEERNYFSLFSWSQVESVEDSLMEDFEISTDPNDIQFNFFPDPHHPRTSEVIIYKNDSSLLRHRSLFKPDRPFKILIHGFRQNSSSYLFPGIVKNAYLNRTKLYGDSYNVFTVNWGKLSGNSQITNIGGFNYIAAMKNVEVVGIRVGNFVSYLLEKGFIQSLSKVHLIGFSLGSHVAGTAGATLRRIYSKKVGRITGLDPAGPGFYSDDVVSQLKNEDAAFLDVIHTSQGTYGTWESIGDVEFFPNGGGPAQPNCLNVMETRDLIGKCSHDVVGGYFAKSITNPSQKARKCSSYVFYKLGWFCDDIYTNFGEFVDIQARGKFYLDIEKTKKQKKKPKHEAID